MKKGDYKWLVDLLKSIDLNMLKSTVLSGLSNLQIKIVKEYLINNKTSVEISEKFNIALEKVFCSLVLIKKYIDSNVHRLSLLKLKPIRLTLDLLKQIDLYRFKWSKRLVKIFMQNRFVTVYDLYNYCSCNKITTLSGVGKQSLFELQTQLGHLGLSFKEGLMIMPTYGVVTSVVGKYLAYIQDDCFDYLRKQETILVNKLEDTRQKLNLIKSRCSLDSDILTLKVI